MLAIDIAIEPLTELRGAKLTWYVGLDSEATGIGDRLWHGESLDERTARRVLALFRLTFADPALAADALNASRVSGPRDDTGADRADEAAKSADRIADQAPGGRQLSPAATPLLRIPVGRCRRTLQGGFCPGSISSGAGSASLPDEPEMDHGRFCASRDERDALLCGQRYSRSLPLRRPQLYRDNLATGAPRIWIVLSPSEASGSTRVSAVTADPAGGEAFTEAGANLVEAVAMPEVRSRGRLKILSPSTTSRRIRQTQQRRADPEVLARRDDLRAGANER